MMKYLEVFKKRIKSDVIRDTFLQIVIGAEETDNFAEYMLKHEKELKQFVRFQQILQVTKGVVAAGSDFFYKAFGNTLEEYFELLAMPRELIMFRSHFEKNGTTLRWQQKHCHVQSNLEKFCHFI